MPELLRWDLPRIGQVIEPGLRVNMLQHLAPLAFGRDSPCPVPLPCHFNDSFAFDRVRELVIDRDRELEEIFAVHFGCDHCGGRVDDDVFRQAFAPKDDRGVWIPWR
ncbi:hypothetical protein D3C74_417030 [compost metagenome]